MEASAHQTALAAYMADEGRCLYGLRRGRRVYGLTR
jgi:hypothetical protein